MTTQSLESENLSRVLGLVFSPLQLTSHDSNGVQVRSRSWLHSHWTNYVDIMLLEDPATVQFSFLAAEAKFLFRSSQYFMNHVMPAFQGLYWTNGTKASQILHHTWVRIELFSLQPQRSLCQTHLEGFWPKCSIFVSANHPTQFQSKFL